MSKHRAVTRESIFLGAGVCVAAALGLGLSALHARVGHAAIDSDGALAAAESWMWIALAAWAFACFLAAWLIVAAVPRSAAAESDPTVVPVRVAPRSTDAPMPNVIEMRRAERGAVESLSHFDRAVAEMSELTRCIADTAAVPSVALVKRADHDAASGRKSLRDSGGVTLLAGAKRDANAQIIAASVEISRQAANLRQEIDRWFDHIRAS